MGNILTEEYNIRVHINNLLHYNCKTYYNSTAMQCTALLAYLSSKLTLLADTSVNQAFESKF